MSDAKHTSGPWQVQMPNDLSPSIWIGAAKNNSITKIELCDYDDGLGHRHTDEDLANARLIAAAPDLLAALEEYLALDENPGQPREWSREARMNVTRAAIAKAKGAA